jgi:predicted MFS family arabinose efflux permease
LRFRLSLLMFLQFAFPGALLQLYSLHLAGLGFEPWAAGLCCATQSLAGVLISLLVGQAADRWFSAERCLAVCAAGAGVVLWFLPALTGFAAVFAATLAFWLLANPILLLGTTISFAHLRRPDRQYGAVRLWGTVGWLVPGWLLLAAALTGVLPADDRAGVAARLIRAGGLFALALAAYAFTLPPTPPRPAAPRRAAPLAALALLRGRAFATLCVCTFGVCVTWSFATQALPLLIGRSLDEIGAGPAWLCPALSIAQVSEVLSLACLPALLAVLGTRRALLLGLSSWALALSVMATGRPPALVLAALALNGVTVAAFFVVGQVHVNRQAADDVRASAQALLTCVNGLGQLAGHLLVGWLRQRSGDDLTQVFGVAALIVAGLVVVFVFGFRERPAPAAEVTPSPVRRRPLAPASR